MKKALTLFTVSAALATSAQAALLYHYTFDVDAITNAGPGTAVATAQGTPTITAGGQSGSFADFDGGNVAGSDAVNVNVAADSIVLGNFAVRLYVNDAASGGNDFDDFLSFTDSNGGEHFFERVGVSTRISFFGDAAIGGTTTGLQDGNWHELLITGATTGVDATLTYSVNGTVQGTSTYAGAAAFTLNNVRIGGRVGADNRFIDAGIDEVQIFNTTAIPEPSSSTFFGLGGLALMLRRRR